jgi:ABC-type amino acid transport system permease subunit
VLERTKEPLLFYGAAAAIYFVVCFSISRFGAVMERRFAYDE